MSTATLNGSCLCGTVSYQVQGQPAKFFHCHCSRCRKATGTGHASNVFVTEASIEWTSLEDATSQFKLPQAERFSTHFCNTCGSLLPREVAKAKLVIIPAGSLDSELDLKPQARIFCGSRATWSCEGKDGIDCFSELPG